MTDQTYPRNTPWGTPTEIVQIAVGIVSYRVRDLGGYFVAAAQALLMPEALRSAGKFATGEAEGLWFEAGEQWALVVLAFPEHFTPESEALAEANLRNWHPAIWEHWTGKTLAPELSYKRRQEVFYTEHQHDLIATDVFGTWCSGVPQGMIGVFAQRGGRQVGRSDGSYWLVPALEYDMCLGTRSREPGFVVDPDRHTPWVRR